MNRLPFNISPLKQPGKENSKHMTKVEILSILPQNAQVSLTDGGTITWDYSTGNAAKVTLGGNRTLSVTNAPNNSSGVLFVTQDGTGSRTLSVPGKKPSGWALSTGAGKIDMVGFYKDGTGTIYWTNPDKDMA